MMNHYTSETQHSNAIPRLCTRCRDLDFDEAFHQADKFYASARDGQNSRSHVLHKALDGVLYYNNALLVHCFQERLNSWSNCPLCQFFRSMRIQPDVHTKYKLLAFCSSESWLFNLAALERSDVWDKIVHTIFMAVVPDIQSIPPNGHELSWLEKDAPAVGLIYRLCRDDTVNTNTILRARALGQRIDFSIPREWLSFCGENHDRVCKPAKSETLISTGFRLIDCAKSPPVVESRSSETRYVALSYVWGDHIQEDWPKTVQDAVAVTKAMGLQYLWVDQLCIDQNNSEEKQYLISAMASIYSNAEFTIVAAAGSGSGFGIPGVRSNPRTIQPKYEFRSGSMLVSTLKDPRLEISVSKWHTRGWTYQESILSRRRLVFTDSQVYWECRCMAIHESVHIPLDLVHGGSRRRMSDFMLRGILKDMLGSSTAVVGDDSHRSDYGFPLSTQDSLLATLRGLEEHIRAFSSRELREDADSLRAFQGVLNLYQSRTLPSLLGIPFWTGGNANERLGARITFALSACSWYHRNDGNLRMFVSEPCRRRDHLPSWTWAGWEGIVSWRAPPVEEHCAIVCSLIEAETVDLLWAAEISITDAKRTTSICLADMISAQDSWSANRVLLEVRNPLVLTEFICIPVPPEEKPWSWRHFVGRSGLNKHDVGSMEWDSEWMRLARKLVFRGVSITMTAEDWSKQHESGHLTSILMFAGRLPANQHGRARFLTLRKIHKPDASQCWERVGIVQLQFSRHLLDRYQTEEEFLAHIPVKQGREPIMIC